ncbi:hypothetical protein D3C72_886660 [compost metagenome]
MAVVVEVAALGCHHLARLAGRHGACLLGAWHVQRHAGLHAIDVAANEGVRIGLHHGDQHLVKRYVGWLVHGSNTTCRIAALHLDRITAAARLIGCRSWNIGTGAGSGLAAAGAACRGAVCRGQWFFDHAHRGRRACNRGWRRIAGDLWSGGDGCFGLLQIGGVEQHGVAAHHLPGVPVGINHVVDKRIIHGPLGGQNDDGCAIGAALQLRFHAAGSARVIHALGTEDGGGGGLDLQGLGFSRCDLLDFDLGAQGLAQSRLHIDLAQCQSRCFSRIQADGGHGRGQCRDFPAMHSAT